METLGPYQITGELGRGGCGVVYSAVDPRIGRKVAIKTIDPEGGATMASSLLERFRREARAAGILSHSNIVTIHEFNDSGEILFIVMEYVEGRTLGQLMASGQLNQNFVVATLSSAAEALDYAHSRNVVHRDVKPSNFLINVEGHVKIADFGIAKITVADAEITTTGTVIGTAQYMSPEQVFAKPVTGRSDQFSLAVVAYEMLTGQKPFQGDSWGSILHQIASADPPPVSFYRENLGPGVTEVLQKALSKEPENRYETCKAFTDQLAAALLGQGSDKTLVYTNPGAHPTACSEPEPATVTMPFSPPTRTRTRSKPASEPASIPVPESTSTSATAPAKAGPARLVLIGVAVVAVAVIAWFAGTHSSQSSSPPKAPEAVAVTQPPAVSAPAQTPAAPGQAPVEKAPPDQRKSATQQPSRSQTVAVAPQPPPNRPGVQPAAPAQTAPPVQVQTQPPAAPPVQQPPAQTASVQPTPVQPPPVQPAPAQPAPVQQAPPQPQPAPAAPPKPAAPSRPTEAEAWNQVANSTDPNALQQFRQNYPGGEHFAAAAQRIEQLDWEKAQRTNDAKSIRDYLSRYPAGSFSAAARADLAKLDQAAADAATRTMITATLNRYRAAFENKDADALKSVWPTLSKTEMSSFQNFFAIARTVKFSVQPLAAAEISGNNATLRCRRIVTASDNRGALPVQDQVVNIHFSKSGDAMLIQSVDVASR